MTPDDHKDNTEETDEFEPEEEQDEGFDLAHENRMQDIVDGVG